MQAAAALADAERQQRAAAAGEADALRADAERRAKAFNTAVTAAVGRVRTELEAERTNLTARCTLHLLCSIQPLKCCMPIQCALGWPEV